MVVLALGSKSHYLVLVVLVVKVCVNFDILDWRLWRSYLELSLWIRLTLHCCRIKTQLLRGLAMNKVTINWGLRPGSIVLGIFTNWPFSCCLALDTHLRTFELYSRFCITFWLGRGFHQFIQVTLKLRARNRMLKFGWFLINLGVEGVVILYHHFLEIGHFGGLRPRFLCLNFFWNHMIL